jgi:hypothetical protein
VYTRFSIKKGGNVRINVTLSHFGVTIVAVQKQEVLRRDILSV